MTESIMIRSILIIALLVCVLLGGCFLQGEKLDIVEGVKWESLGGNESCITVDTKKYSISGDLHVEFLDNGILVSKWESTTSSHQYVYIDLRNDERIITIGLPEQASKMRRTKQTYRSYGFSCLVRGADNREEQKSFEHEKEELMGRLNRSLQ